MCRLYHGALQLLMWWRGQWPIELAKEASCAALSSLPPPNLKLHSVFALRFGTLLLRCVGGHSFYSCNILAAGLFEGGVSSQFIPGWNPEDKLWLWLLFGSWPDSSMRLVRVTLVTVLSLAVVSAAGQRSGCRCYPQHQGWRVIFAIKYSPWHLLHTTNRFALNCHVWVMSKAQTVVNVAQAMPGLMVPRCQQSITTSKDGGHHCPLFSSFDHIFFTAVTQHNVS